MKRTILRSWLRASVGILLCGLMAQAPRSRAEGNSEEMEPWLKQRLEWFQDLKFGFMMHWGAYSQWGCIESWPLVEEDKWARPEDLKAWTERGKDIERFKRDYWALSKTFNPEKFEPAQWARTAKDAGMKYVVFTTKHHDGFCMFDTWLTDYRITAPDVPFHTTPPPTSRVKSSTPFANRASPSALITPRPTGTVRTIGIPLVPPPPATPT